MIRLRPVGLRGLDPRAQVPNIAHGLRCDAKLCCDARRQGVAHLSIRLGFKDLDRLRICVHLQAEYMSNVPEFIARKPVQLPSPCASLGRTRCHSPYLFPAECRGRSGVSLGVHEDRIALLWGGHCVFFLRLSMTFVL